jgi:hypothetical protein
MEYPIDHRDELGRKHCLNGPAFIGISGYKGYYIHGIRHREDGPARTMPHTDMHEWYICGIEVSKDEWIQWLKDGNSSLSTNKVTRLILEWS